MIAISGFLTAIECNKFVFGPTPLLEFIQRGEEGKGRGMKGEEKKGREIGKGRDRKKEEGK